MARLRAYKVGGEWRVDIPGNGEGFDVMRIDPGSGTVRDAGGARTLPSDIAMTLDALRYYAPPGLTTEALAVADRVQAWAKRRPRS